MPLQNVLSITKGMRMHSFLPHMTAILSPIYAGSWKRKVRLPSLNTTDSLAPLQNIKEKLKAPRIEMLIPTQATTTIGRDCFRL